MGNYVRGGYHRGRAAWERVQVLNGKYIGIELEVNHRRGYEQLLEILPDPEDELDRPATETDASIPNGVEIVFPPISYADIRNPAKFFSRAMTALREGGADTRDEYCAMHMNINTSHWSQDKVTAFSVMINMLNPRYLENIGGRRLNNYCRQYTINRFVSAMRGAIRYAATVRDRSTRIECRFPKATMDIDQIKLLTDFFELVERYVGSQVRSTAIKDTCDGRRSVEDVSRRLTADFMAWLERIRTNNAPRVREVLLNGYR